MSTVTNGRRPLKPATGTCRWVRRIAWPYPGVLEINGTAYTVVPLTDGGCGPAAPVVGYRLVKPDGTLYDLPADLSECDCPDRTNRPGRPDGCKHMRALRAALTK